MKRVIYATTFYAVDPKRPYDTAATFPGFTLEEAVDCMTTDRMLGRYVPLTFDEYSKLIKAIKKSNDSPEAVYDKMKGNFKYSKYEEDPEGYQSSISYSFWACGAYDTATSYYAYGADTVGGYEFNLGRISKRLGERRFYSYSAIKGKRFKDYASLVKYLKDAGCDTSSLSSSDELIEACQEDTYYICQSR